MLPTPKKAKTVADAYTAIKEAIAKKAAKAEEEDDAEVEEDSDDNDEPGAFCRKPADTKPVAKKPAAAKPVAKKLAAAEAKKPAAKAAKMKLAAAIPLGPSVSHEASRSQILGRTGLKGAGQSKSFQYGHGKPFATVAAARAAAVRWMKSLPKSG